MGCGYPKWYLNHHTKHLTQKRQMWQLSTDEKISVGAWECSKVYTTGAENPSMHAMKRVKVTASLGLHHSPSAQLRTQMESRPAIGRWTVRRHRMLCQGLAQMTDMKRRNGERGPGISSGCLEQPHLQNPPPAGLQTSAEQVCALIFLCVWLLRAIPASRMNKEPFSCQRPFGY